MNTILTRRFPARPLALLRIVVGISAIMLAMNTRTNLLRIARPGSLHLPTANWLPTVTEQSVSVLIGAWLVAAVLLTVGLRSRAAALTCAACPAAAAFWDVQTLSNHQTLFIALCGLLALSRCGAALGVDARRRGGQDDVPYWPVFLLQLQVTSMYGFTAVSKVTPTFLSGQVLRENVPLAAWAEAQWSGADVILAMVLATIVVELFLAGGLWFRRTRLVAVVAGVGLHLTILVGIPHLSHELGPFALLSIGTYVLFLGSDLDLPRLQWGRSRTTAF